MINIYIYIFIYKTIIPFINEYYLEFQIIGTAGEFLAVTAVTMTSGACQKNAAPQISKSDDQGRK